MSVTVTHRPDSGHFIAMEEGAGAGYIEYKLRGGDAAILHTIVDPAFEGKGVGSALAQAALTTARESGWGVLPYCPFISGYIRKHPEWLDLVPAARRADFDLPAE
ncbi:MAG: N-acetyltransferase [Propionibacteriaceae bacterium]|jgi:predicted GNAT family acetyltransferase|nr:N-acetyltransferase [Propionibacteriaceae bacterium]